MRLEDEEILALSNDDLDMLVAEKVMGWRRREIPDPLFPRAMRAPEGGSFQIPEYSTDLRAAWDVFERILKEVPSLALGLHPKSGKPCVFDNAEYGFVPIAVADTFPRAICLAALKMMEEDHR